MFDLTRRLRAASSQFLSPPFPTTTMSSKSSKSNMKQIKLSFGASKATAAANKAKKEVSEPSSSTSKRPTRSAASKAGVVNVESDEEINVDDIGVSEKAPSSESEIEEADSEDFSNEKGQSGKSVVVKRETRASKAKAKAEEAVAPAKVLGVPAEAKPSKKDATIDKKSVEEEAALRPSLNIKNRAYDKISHETRAKRGFAQTSEFNPNQSLYSGHLTTVSQSIQRPKV